MWVCCLLCGRSSCLIVFLLMCCVWLLVCCGVVLMCVCIGVRVILL